jgi:hypothetical protein
VDDDDGDFAVVVIVADVDWGGADDEVGRIL